MPRDDFLTKYVERVCHGNRFTTTLLYLCQGLAKLGQLTTVSKVYRVPGGQPPPWFFEASADGTRGGIECGFTSATLAKDDAIKYAISSGNPMIFEIRHSTATKGADLSWLSQFPMEGEVTFGPLTLYEVQSTRSEGALMVFELCPSLCAAADLSRVALDADRRLCDVMGMLRADAAADGSVFERITSGVISLGGQPVSEDGKVETMLDRAKANHTRVALLSQTTRELSDTVAADVMALDSMLEIAGANQHEIAALTNHAKVRARTSARRVERLLEAEAQAARESSQVERLREYTSLEESRWRLADGENPWPFKPHELGTVVSPKMTQSVQLQMKRSLPSWGCP